MGTFKTVASAILLFITATAIASEGLYLGPSISHYRLDKDRSYSGSSDSTLLGANLGYRFSGPIAIEAGYAQNIGGQDLDVIKLDLLYYLSDRNGWAPYFLLGLTDFDRDKRPSLKNGEHSTQQLGAGFGVSKMLNQHWQARGDGRFQQKISGGESGTIDLAFNLGINYYFNPPAVAAVVQEPEPAPALQPAPQTRAMTIRLNVEFEFDKDVVRNIYGDEIQSIANAMKVHDDIELVLEGHTDSVGSEAYNQNLSARRAAAVKARIVEDYGIPSNRISTVGYGESRPIADNNTDEGRARNRRVVGELTFTEVVGD